LPIERSSRTQLAQPLTARIWGKSVDMLRT
jgi:hypothetical protein